MNPFTSFVLLSVAAAASAMPRYLVVPLEDVEFVDDALVQHNSRVTRAAADGDDDGPAVNPFMRSRPEGGALDVVGRAIEESQFKRGAPPMMSMGGRPSMMEMEDLQPGQSAQVYQAAQAKQDGGPGFGGAPGPFIAAINGAGIPTDLASAPSNIPAATGSDYVDYGAYTGKGGAFGWYSDHPVLIFHH